MTINTNNFFKTIDLTWRFIIKPVLNFVATVTSDFVTFFAFSVIVSCIICVIINFTKDNLFYKKQIIVKNLLILKYIIKK